MPSKPVFLKRDNPFMPISNESNVVGMIVKGGRIIINFLNLSKNNLYVNFTIVLESFEDSKNVLSSSAILKIDTRTYYVYDESNNFIGKWMYMLSSNVPTDLEENKPIMNCTLALANYHNEKINGACMKTTVKDKERYSSYPYSERKNNT